MKLRPESKTWAHLSGIPGNTMEADFECTRSNLSAKSAVVGDFDGDGKKELLYYQIFMTRLEMTVG
jgi:hypothetical protein